MRAGKSTLAIAAVVVALALVVFAALAVVAVRAPYNSIDLAISLHVQRLTFADALWRAVSWFGYRPMAMIVPAVAVALLIVVRWWRDAAFATASIVGSWLLDHAVKLAITRTRPIAPVELREPLSLSPSFPSGHVMQYVALFGFALVIVHVRVTAPLARYVAMTILVALVVLVGPSRVYLGAHWPTDALAAYMLAGAWVVIVGRAYVTASARARTRRPAHRSASRETRRDPPSLAG